MSTVLDAGGYGLCALGWSAQILAWLRRTEPFWAAVLFLACNVAWGIGAITRHDRTAALIFTALAVVWAFAAWWSWRRRKRRRALAALGAKARARIAAMTARMRERPARPALRPVPAGAR